MTEIKTIYNPKLNDGKIFCLTLMFAANKKSYIVRQFISQDLDLIEKAAKHLIRRFQLIPELSLDQWNLQEGEGIEYCSLENRDRPEQYLASNSHYTLVVGLMKLNAEYDWLDEYDEEYMKENNLC